MQRHLKLIAEVKTSLRLALRNGSIQRVVDRVDTGLPTDHSGDPADFAKPEIWAPFNDVMPADLWAEFERIERLFRATVRTNHANAEVRFAHRDFRPWLRLFEKLKTLLAFLEEQHDVNAVMTQRAESSFSPDFELRTLKFVWRILNKFPIQTTDRPQQESERDELQCKIEEALHYTDHTIFPSLRQYYRRTRDRQDEDTARRIEKHQLNQLWLENQKRAIEIIRSDSLVKGRQMCTIPADTLTEYFQEKSEKILQYPLPSPPWPCTVNPPPPEVDPPLQPFTEEEVLAVLKTLRNKTAPGYDGVEYSFLKQRRHMVVTALTIIFNICLKNRKIPSDWKHAVVTLIPKKGGNVMEPSDWRPISLLTSFYKIYMKLVQGRLLPWIVSTGRLSPRQKGSLPRNGLQEHVFCLKASIENFKHMSTPFFTTFVDIRDAYGSIDHRVMLDSMERASYPQLFIDITRDIYTDSTFQVQAGDTFTPRIIRHRGIIQGCPWSATVFIQALDPWIRWMEQPFLPNTLPTPCQAYMDDVCASSHSEDRLHEMLNKTESFLNYTGMKVKHAKCATLHGQRCGNNWSSRDNTGNAHLTLQGDELPMYDRDRPYTYLGFQTNLLGSSDKNQLVQICDEFQKALDQIDISPLSLCKKIDAVNVIASSKLNFYYSNMRFSKYILTRLEDQIVAFVRANLKLNTSTNRAHMFLPRKHGGLGLLKPGTLYNAKRVSFLVSVLNSDDQNVRLVARNSFHLHMEKRKVPRSEDVGESFGGYSTDGDGVLQKISKVNWARSSFVELNEICVRLKLTLEYDEVTDSFGIVLPASDDGIVRLRYANSRELYSAIKRMEMDKDFHHVHGLQQQGRLFRDSVPSADMNQSSGHLTNHNINDHLTRFITKGRLQLLETNAVCHTYYPHTYHSHCSLCAFHTDTVSHALNGCRALKGLYTQRHDRCVEIIKRELLKYTITEFVDVFHNRIVPFGNNTHQYKPDLCLIDHANSKAFIVEVSNPFDPFIQTCYESKFQKYMPLCFSLTEQGFDTKVVVIIVGSLGIVHKHVVPGLCMLGFSKSKSKTLAKYLSMSVMIGSRRVWVRRQHLVNRQ